MKGHARSDQAQAGSNKTFAVVTKRFPLIPRGISTICGAEAANDEAQRRLGSGARERVHEHVASPALFYPELIGGSKCRETQCLALGLTAAPWQ